MNRREFISGMLATLGGTAMAESVRSNVAARGISLSGSGDGLHITIENNCANCLEVYNEVLRLVSNADIQNAVVRWPLDAEVRNNTPLAFLCWPYSSVGMSISRYRNGQVSTALVRTEYDADIRIGDIYEVLPFEVWGD